MTLLKLGFWFTFLYSFTLWSGVKQVWEMENNLRTRVKNVLNSYDPTANISVTIETKKIDVSLPGTTKRKSQVLMLDETGSVSDESISKVIVRVSTHAAGKGNWLDAEIRKEINMGKIPVEVKVIPFSKQQLETMKNVAQVLTELNTQIHPESLKKETDDKTEATDLPRPPSPAQINVQMAPSPLGDWFFWQKALMPFVLILLSGFLLHAWLMKTWLVKNINSAPVEASRNEQDRNPQVKNNFESNFRKAPVVPGNQERFDSFPVEVLQNLLADCYWCEKDSYASYVWRRMAPGQQNQLLKSVKIPSTYFKMISDWEELDEKYIGDPTYLEENPWIHTSQEDLLNTLNTHPGLYKALSRMRKDSLEITLEERIKFQQSFHQEKIDTSFKYRSSELRHLDNAVRVKSITFEDELWLMTNHLSLEEATVKNINSLVWLVLSPKEDAKSVLDSFDARSLASAWYGHPNVLKKMAELVSEGKMKNVSYFLQQKEAKPDSDEFSILTGNGRELYFKSRVKRENTEKKAA